MVIFRRNGRKGKRTGRTSNHTKTMDSKQAGNIPTYMTDKGESNIDVTMTTENVKGNILE